MIYYIYFSSGGYYDIAYQDLIGKNNILFISNFLLRRNKVSTFFFRYFFFFNKVKPLARYFSFFLFPRIYKDELGEGIRCFLFDERTLFLYNSGYLEYLKSRYPSCKFICILHDKVYTITNVNLSDIKKFFDIIFSYDLNDSHSNGFIYRPTSYSITDCYYKNFEPKKDVIFIGQVKSRMGKILSIYSDLIKFGFDFEFYLINVKESERVELPNIIYCDWLSYSEVLKKTLEFRCILELMQEDSKNITFRTWEAISYDKYLLTDNNFILETPFYNEKYMFLISDGIEAFSSKYKGCKPVYTDKFFLTPLNLINDIKKLLK